MYWNTQFPLAFLQSLMSKYAQTLQKNFENINNNTTTLQSLYKSHWIISGCSELIHVKF